VRKGLLTVGLAGLLTAGLMGAPAQAATGDRPKVVYLTFDDGPNASNDPRLLRVLRREQVPATFFMVGSALAGDPGAARRLYLAGHALGNHSWSHADLTHLSAAGVAAELRHTQRLLAGMGGACMRPPYGAVNTTVMTEASRLGMRVVLWNVDPLDWAHQDSTSITNHVLTHVRDRSVVLLHDGGGPRAATTTAVARIIPALRARGFEFRTVPACRVPLRMEMVDAGRPERRPKPTPPVPTPTPTPPVVLP
jgi:peptidoglycan/xylan/chitin deacetylase (PgdA/CDA1 family)